MLTTNSPLCKCGHSLKEHLTDNGICFNKECNCFQFTPQQNICKLCGKPKEEHYYKMDRNDKKLYCKGVLTDVNDNPEFTPLPQDVPDLMECEGCGKTLAYNPSHLCSGCGEEE